MAKIARKNQKQFGSTASAGELGVFGSFAAGSPAYSSDVETIQSLSNWLDGWYAAVDGENSPAIQDMNALFFVICYQLAYLFQAGIAEWDDATTYYTGSLVLSGSIIYQSLTDDNLNNAVTDVTNWIPLRNSTVMSTKAADYTVLASDEYIRVSATATMTLPDVAAVPTGTKYIFKNVSASGVVTIAGNGAQVIDVANTIELLAQDSLTVINNGSSWDVI